MHTAIRFDLISLGTNLKTDTETKRELQERIERRMKEERKGRKKERKKRRQQSSNTRRKELLSIKRLCSPVSQTVPPPGFFSGKEKRACVFSLSAGIAICA
mmetsp:Transcript_24859/g.48698  ORF Transcript_24859/g.48698 Transcript_24859/m.48698 type:complete len:101 (-) Transcript_24859:1287-1589(-)